MIIALLIIGAIFVILEIVTSGVLLIFIGLGFLTSGLVLALTGNIIITFLSGVIVTTLSIVVIRKPILKRLKTKDTMSGSDAIIGKKGIVAKRYESGSTIYGTAVISGVTWNVISNSTIEVDQSVEVIKIEGSHLVVKG